MSRSYSAHLLGPEFDDFLSAPLGDERNGMRLNVLSALARLEVDPWQEAAQLANLPGTIAIERLASLIALLPVEPSMDRDPDTTAARLVALLPRGAISDIAPLETLIRAGKTTHSWAVVYVSWSLLCVMLIVLALGAELTVTGDQVPEQANKVQTLVAGISPPQSLKTSDR
jgi:hypothetical protein